MLHSCIWLLGLGGWKPELYSDSGIEHLHILKLSLDSQISSMVLQNFRSEDSNSISGSVAYKCQNTSLTTFYYWLSNSVRVAQIQREGNEI